MRYSIVTALASLLATGAVTTDQCQPLPTPAIPTPPPPPATTAPPTTTPPPPTTAPPSPSPTPDRSCVLEYGVNYVGNDIGGATAASPEECCDKCRGFPGCRAFTYSLWWAENVCFFKSGKADTNPDPSVVSCAVGLKDGQTFAPTLPPTTSPKITPSPSASASPRPRA
jgi:hypothetical protein